MTACQCPAEREYGDHLYVKTYRRPWRKWFRKEFHVRCWECDLDRPDR